MTLESKLALTVAAKLTQSQDLGAAVASALKSFEAVLTDGTAAGKADKIFADTRTLAASASEDLDLAGVLLDPLGAALTFVKVKGLLIKAADGNTNDVVVGNSSSNTWAALLNSTGTVKVRPGGVLAVFAGAADATGYAVTGGTGDLLKVANGGAGTSVSYDVVVIGTSA